MVVIYIELLGLKNKLITGGPHIVVYTLAQHCDRLGARTKKISLMAPFCAESEGRMTAEFGATRFFCQLELVD